MKMKISTALTIVALVLTAGTAMADKTGYTGNGSLPDPTSTPGPQDHDNDGQTPGSSGTTPAADGGSNPHGKVNPTVGKG